jgi:ABC-2 type transport system permease protein
MSGFPTLLYKELLRVWKVAFQTVAAPVLTALLYLLIFAQALGDSVRVFDSVPYASFLVPGLVMMSVLQNAFANSSSSFIQSKVTGNLVFILLPPISHVEFYWAYVIASILRGLLVDVPVAAPAWAIVFALLGAGVLGALGLIAGLWADRFDQLAAFQNFVIMPFTFLAGVFYSIHALPAFWQKLSHLNPFFYMIDGFRYGFFGRSDVPPAVSLLVCGVSFALLTLVALHLLRTGYKIRH